jgi:hypothetical protein
MGCCRHRLALITHFSFFESFDGIFLLLLFYNCKKKQR